MKKKTTVYAQTVFLALSAPVFFYLLKTLFYLGPLFAALSAAVIMSFLRLNAFAGTHTDAVKRFATAPAVPAVQIALLIAARCFVSKPFTLMLLMTVALTFFSWVLFKLLMLRSRPGWGAAAAAYTAFLAAMLVATTLFAPEHFKWFRLISPSFIAFEAAYAIRLRAFQRRVYFVGLIVADSFALFAAAAKLFPAYGKNAVALYLFSAAGFAAYALYGFLAARIGAIRETPFLRAACGAGVFLAILFFINIVYHKSEPCDYRRIEKNFIVLSKESGSYDMVLGPEGRYLYVVYGEAERNVEKIDTAGKEKTKILKLPGDSQPERLIYDRARDRIIVSNWGEARAKLIALDARTFRIVRWIGGAGLPERPIAVTADPGFHYYYLLGETEAEAVRIDADTFRTTARYDADYGAGYGICYSRPRKSVFVITWIGPNVDELSAGTLSPRKRTRAAILNYGISCDPYSDRVYAAAPIRSKVIAFGGRKLKRIRAYRAGFGVRPVQADSRRDLLVAGSYFEGSLDLIRLSDGARIAHYRPGAYIRGLYYDPASGRIFTGCKCGVFELRERYGK